MHNDPEHSDCDRNNADAHLRAMLLGHSMTLQVTGGELVLGQWQRVLPPSSTARGALGPRSGAGRGLVTMRAASCVARPHRHRRQARGRRPAHLRRRADAVRLPGHARARLARQPRAREAPRRAHLLQLQHPPRSDQRLRRQLPLLLVRAAEARRRRLVHDVARRGVGQAAAARPSAAHRSPRRQRPASGSAVRLLPGAAAGLQTDPARAST